MRFPLLHLPSGCGFLLPFHFGVVAALLDHGIKFEKASATSGGVMAALAILGGADLEVEAPHRDLFAIALKGFFAYCGVALINLHRENLGLILSTI